MPQQNSTGNFIDTFEHVAVEIFPDNKEGSRYVAQQIADLMREKERKGQHCVLGLATGSSPQNVYAELVRMHQQEGLSFKHVITFNLDEYYPIEHDALQSFHRYMWERLFKHVDILPENVHIPDGTIPKDQIKVYCQQYEAEIEKVGGLICNCWASGIMATSDSMNRAPISIPGHGLLRWIKQHE